MGFLNCDTEKITLLPPTKRLLIQRQQTRIVLVTNLVVTRIRIVTTIKIVAVTNELSPQQFLRYINKRFVETTNFLRG